MSRAPIFIYFYNFKSILLKKNILRQPTKNKIFHIVLITEKSLKT